MSVYLELCEILGISLNEFLAGEDIEVTNVEKKIGRYTDTDIKR